MHRLRFGTDYYARDIADYPATVRACEAIGLDLLGHGDSPCLWHDPYVALAVAATVSHAIRLAPMVTNPVTRDPSVTAAAMIGLQELSGGRAVLGLGGGDSALLNAGLRPATIGETAAYATAVRTLTEGGEATWQDRTFKLRWPAHPQPVPVFLAAEGPRRLALAGEIADGVIVSNGFTREVVADTVQTVHDAARRVGRQPPEIWWMVTFQLAPSAEEGVTDLRWLLAAAADHVFRFTLVGKRVPPDKAEAVRELMVRYLHSEHSVAAGSDHNAALVDDLGLRTWLAHRFAVTGTPEECVDRIREIAGYGATNLLFTQLVPDQLDLLARLGADVLEQLR
jgi:5,10-methylenetetrahydromethanopterin reductase